MAARVNKTLKKAQKFVEKRLWDKAITEYQKLGPEELGDQNLHNILGDIYLAKGDTHQAVQEFMTAADRYQQRGFSVKAIAILRKILRHAPHYREVYLRLADLYADEGLIQDARLQYETLARNHLQESEHGLALEVYHKILEMDPSQPDVHLQIAEILTTVSEPGDAVRYFVRAGQLFLSQDRVNYGFDAYRKAIAIDEKNINAWKGIANIYDRLGKTDRATQTLRTILRLDRDDLSALFQLGRIYLKQGKHTEGLPIFEQILRIDPNQKGIREIIGRIYLRQGNFSKAYRSLEPSIDNFIQHKKYENALKILHQLQELAPEDLTVRRKSGEIFLKMEMPQRACTEFDHIVKILHSNGKTDHALMIYEKLHLAHPKEQEIRKRYYGWARTFGKKVKRAIELKAPVQSKPKKASPAPETKAPAHTRSDMETTKSIVNIEEMIGEADVFVKYGLYDNAANRLRQVLGLNTDHIRAHELLKEIYSTTEKHEAFIMETLTLGDLYIKSSKPDLALQCYREIMKIDPDNFTAVQKMEKLDRELSALSLTAPSETETSESDDLSDDPLGELQTLASDLFKEEEFPVLAPSVSPVGTGIDSSDLSADDTDVDISKVISEFQKDVNHNIASDDYETHFNLGFAYMEMGLISEAIREFSIAMRDSSLLVPSCDHTGMCYLHLGQHQDAIRFLRKGLEHSPQGSDSWLALQYNLGQTYKLAGDYQLALDNFKKIKDLRSSFRNTDAEIIALQKRITQV